MNSVVTGFGRSGTKFLSTMINKCTDTQSFHERTANALQKQYSEIDECDFVEVNSYYRYCFKQPSANFFLLLRKPSEICFSISKRYVDERRKVLAFEDLIRWYDFLLKNIDSETKIYFFERFTKEKFYLFSLMKDLGCLNIDVSKIKDNIDIKINKSKTKAKSLEDSFTEKQIEKIREMDFEYEKIKNIYNR